MWVDWARSSVCVCFVLIFNFCCLPIYFVFISIYNVTVFAENVCVIYNVVFQFIQVLCVKCTKSIRHLLYVIVFVLSIFLPRLIIICSGNVLVV
jgi:hypothetical protein